MGVETATTEQRSAAQISEGRSVAQAMIENNGQVHMVFARADRLPTHSGEKLTLIARPDRWLEVRSARFSPQEAAAFVQRVQDANRYLGERGKVRGIAWHAVSETEAATPLERMLEELGFEQAGINGQGEQLEVMGLDLAKLPEALEAPEGYTFKRVESLHELEQALRTSYLATYGKEMPAGMLKHELRVFAAGGFSEDAALQHYIGYYQCEPVSTVMVCHDGNVAGVYGVGTVPELHGESTRRRGFGSQTVIRALQDSKQRGYRMAVLNPTDEGRPVYRKIGFQQQGYRRLYALPLE